MDEFLKKIIVEAGDLAKDYFLKGVTFKTKTHLADLITEADIAVSNLLVKRISEKYPDHSIYSEEEKMAVKPGAEYEWIIDPIDGTRNFAMGVGSWCVMVAVHQNGEGLIGAVYNPLDQELFFGHVGRGASLNGMPIRVNDVESLDQSYGMMSRAVTDDYTKKENYKRLMAYLINETSVWFHNFGTMLGACYVAMGAADFVAVNTGKDYDNAAVAVICAEAGAIVTNADGEPWTRDRNDIVIANPKLHPKILELLQ